VTNPTTPDASISAPSHTFAPSHDRTVIVPSKRSIAKATLIALVVAGIVLATTVLPAEYGIDPLGTGKALGLTEISAGGPTVIVREAAAGGPIAQQAGGYKIDAIEFSLIPGGSVEYKYRLEKGAPMLYSWVADAPIEFDMHTEPDGKGAEGSDSFEAGTAPSKNGSYTAPYAGIHGWYWHNTTDKLVSIKLTTAGFYSVAKMFDETGKAYDFEVKNPPPPETP
jgi:hypothetical protein